MATKDPNRTGYTAAYTAPGTGIQWNTNMYLGNHIGIAEFTSAISSSYTSFANCWVKSATIKIRAKNTLSSNSIIIGVTNTAPPSPSANPPATPSCYRSGTFTCNKTGITTIDITKLFRRGGTNSLLKPNDTKWYIVFKMTGSTSNILYGKDDFTSTFTYTIAAKPSVSAGSKITAAQVITLAQYLDTQNSTGGGGGVSSNISEGYKIKHDDTNSLVANTAGTKIDDSWYNDA